MAEWIVEQFMKLALATCLSGIGWVAVALLAWTIPYWVIWVVCVLVVYGVIFGLEHSDGHWDFF